MLFIAQKKNYLFFHTTRGIIRHDIKSSFQLSILKPEEYLNHWVPKLYGVKPDERGYRKTCIDEMHRVTGISKNTINTWGPMFEHCPDHVHRTLEWVDLLHKIRELISVPIELPKS